MLIPLNKDASLTTISLSTIYFFSKHKLSKSILYISCINSAFNSTSLIIKKYFSERVDTLDVVDFSKVFFASYEYDTLLNKIIEECYQKKFLYDLILIEGVQYNHSINAEQINFDISQNSSAEVIFIENLKYNSSEYIQKKENKIKLFLENKKYKNILGIIFNEINSPFIDKQCNFIQKLKILRKKEKNKRDLIIKKKLFKNQFFSTIACIPWNKKIIKTNILEIYRFLNIKCLNLIEKKSCYVEKIMIFDENYINISNKNYSNTLVILSFSRINIFLNFFKLNLKMHNIQGVILTGVLNSKKNIISLCQVFIRRCIYVLFTKLNTLEILSQLCNFNFNIYLKDKIYINKLQKYVSSFFCYSSITNFKKKYSYNKKYSPKEFCLYIKLLSREKNKRILLPESYEIRILKAASICHDDKIAQCVLLGESKKIYRIADNAGIKLSRNIEIINPISIRKNYVNRLVELRKTKGMNELLAKKQLEDNIVLATLILEADQVDGLVSGSVNTTYNTIRPALQIIKTSPNSLLVSSIFFMLLPNSVLIYGDCAININPTAEELAEIAIQTADSSKIFGIEPRIAMLSYSTGNSGIGYEVEKVRTATCIVKKRRPDLIIDGPIQYDTAISKTVAKLKAPNSPILGSANIFIFPDLNSGNIAYKAVQRSSKILSIGPMLQGLKKPVNDLSRGASIEDIIYTIALTSIQDI